MEPGSPVTERKMLLGIKALADPLDACRSQARSGRLK